TRLSDFAKELLEQKIHSFSLYKMLDELKDVLRKYKINRENITNIKQFSIGMCVSSEEASDAIKENKNIMCIAKGKPHNVEIESYHTNKKKRMGNEAFQNNDYDYLYGIIPTALKEDIDSIQKRVK
ncbi:24611_t:CDS:2, partial [Gigaspora margarita]